GQQHLEFRQSAGQHGCNLFRQTTKLACPCHHWLLVIAQRVITPPEIPFPHAALVIIQRLCVTLETESKRRESFPTDACWRRQQPPAKFQRGQRCSAFGVTRIKAMEYIDHQPTLVVVIPHFIENVTVTAKTVERESPFTYGYANGVRKCAKHFGVINAISGTY